MKRALIFLFTAMLISLSASAYSFSAPNDDGVEIYYNITSTSGREVAVTYRNTDYDSYSGDVKIPETVVYNGTTYTVTAIGNHAIHKCTDLISVSIPNTVKTIGNAGVADNSTLKSVSIGESVITIDSRAFSGCSSLTTLFIPNSVKTIGQGAFNGCTGLTTVSIGESVTDIKSETFKNCRGLIAISIPNSVKTIGGSAFFGCSSLTAVTIPNSVKTIGGSAFQGCSGLTTVTIGEGVEIIGSDAFSECSSLTAVNIPNSVTSIGGSAFFGCSSLTAVTIPNSVKTIGGSAFQGCSGLTTVTLGEGVTSIPDWVFCDCTGLTTVNIPNSVTSIREMAFGGCSGLTAVTIGEGVETIGEYAFKNCSSLTAVNIPNSVKTIGGSAFQGCSGLTAVNIPNSVKSIGSNAFSGCSGLTTVTIGEGVETIGSYAFYGCSGLTAVNIPNSVKSIGSNAFQYCSGLTAVTIGEGVASIGNAAFYGCSDLTTVNLPNSVKTIGGSAFRGCSGLTTVTIGEGVETIGDYAFYGCSGPTAVNIPNSVTSIGGSAFSGVDAVFTMNHVAPPCDFVFGVHAVVLVPEASVEAYKAAWTNNVTQILAQGVPNNYEVTVEARDNSSDVMDKVNCQADQFDAMLNVLSLKVTGTINGYDIMTIRNKMVNLRDLDLSEAQIVYNPYEYYTGCHTENDILGAQAFSGCANLRSVKLPKSITSIRNSAFQYCSNIKSIVVPEQVVYIGDNAFSQCTSLKEVVLPPALTTIRSSAFYGCYPLESIELPPAVRKIESYAFSGCSNLKSVRLPESIESIGDRAFQNTSIRDVYCWSAEPVAIGQDTFSESTFKNATLHVPATAQKLYYWDTQWSQFLNKTSFSEPYTYFYLQNRDLEIDADTERFHGVPNPEGGVDNPDADLRPGGGLIVEGQESQDLGDVSLGSDGSNTSGTIIGDNGASEGQGNVNIDNLSIKISITRGKWYFFAFPFDIDYSNIHFNGQFVWRYYDGEYRAEKGSGAWKNHTGKLVAGRGYIFQASKDGTLTLVVGKASIGGDDKMVALETHASANPQDAGWNLVGNPFTSYYELGDLSFNAPVTVWNPSTNSYEAFSPLDDDYTFYPFQAFFTQKPTGSEGVGFDAAGRRTRNQTQDPDHRKAARQRRMARAEGLGERLLIDLTVTDGTGAADKTRVVVNEAASMAYEVGRDASKFISATAPQIYTVCDGGVMCSINERPKGSSEIGVGFMAPADGVYTIAGTRMDCKTILVDLETGITHDLSTGDYTFTAVKGSTGTRFLIRFDTTTGVDGLDAGQTDEDAVYYNLDGTIATGNPEAGKVVIRKSARGAEKIYNRN